MRRAQHEIATHGDKRFGDHFEYLGVTQSDAGYLWDRNRRLLMPVVTIAGPGSRYYAGGSASEYATLDALSTDAWMDPTRSTDGDGTLGTPWRWQQMVDYNPGGAKHVVTWLPGYIQAVPGDKFPLIQPDHSGTSTNPQIWRGQYKATNSNTTSQQKSGVQRASGSGSFLGTQSTNHLWVDGLDFPNWHGANGSENFMVSGWSTTGLRFSRCVLDGQASGNVTDDSTNCGAIYFQEATDCKVTDCIIRNIGSTSGQQLWSGIEYYSCTNLQTYNNLIHAIRGFGIFEKGVIGVNYNIANRHHHSIIHSVARYCIFQYLHSSGTTLANATWWYQNILRDAGVHGYFAQALGSMAHPTQSGVVVANNIMARAAGAGINIKWFAGVDYEPLQVFRNNIIYDNTSEGLSITDGSWALTMQGEADFDRNRYDSNGVVFNDSDGDRTFIQLQDLVGVSGDIEQNGTTGDPGFENAASNDWRLTSGSTCRNTGADYLSLLGGSSSAAINVGPYITAGMTDSIGCRTSL